jgi:thioesterase domain-containing protein/aryl carrier-like protein
MIPSIFVRLDWMPLTPNGKVDRKALPALEHASSSTRFFDPPRDSVEAHIASIWEDLLGETRVGRRDNFFDLGGDSLRLMKMQIRLRESYKKDLPLGTIMESPTVESIAAWLHDYRSKDHSLLVQMTIGLTDQHPLFFVHASDGTEWSMQPLAKALGPERPFYCLLGKGHDGSEPFSTVEEAAGYYLTEIRKIQPQGPYDLGGYCFGGMVAFEMARLLRESGKRVANLFIIDGYNPSFLRFKLSPELLGRLTRFCVRRTRAHFQNIMNLRKRMWLSYGTARFKAFSNVIRRVVNKSLRSEPRSEAGESPSVLVTATSDRVEQILERLKQAGPRASRQFFPKPYRGDAVLFRSSERTHDPFEDVHLGWRKIIQGTIESIEIDANHEQLIRNPAVRQIAQRIELALQKTSGRSRAVS